MVSEKGLTRALASESYRKCLVDEAVERQNKVQGDVDKVRSQLENDAE